MEPGLAAPGVTLPLESLLTLVPGAGATVFIAGAGVHWAEPAG